MFYKRVSTKDQRFSNRKGGIVALDGKGEVYIIEREVPNDQVICNGCGVNLYPGDGLLVYTTFADAVADRPYDVYCEPCCHRLFPGAADFETMDLDVEEEMRSRYPSDLFKKIVDVLPDDLREFVLRTGVALQEDPEMRARGQEVFEKIINAFMDENIAIGLHTSFAAFLYALRVARDMLRPDSADGSGSAQGGKGDGE